MNRAIIYFMSLSYYLSTVTITAVKWWWRVWNFGWKETTRIFTWFFVILYTMNSFVEKRSSFPLENEFTDFHWWWAQKSGNGVHLIKRFELFSTFAVISWYQCMKLDDDHAGCLLNERADELADLGALSGEEQIFPGPLKHGTLWLRARVSLRDRVRSEQLPSR